MEGGIFHFLKLLLPAAIFRNKSLPLLKPQQLLHMEAISMEPSWLGGEEEGTFSLPKITTADGVITLA